MIQMRRKAQQKPHHPESRSAGPDQRPRSRAEFPPPSSSPPEPSMTVHGMEYLALFGQAGVGSAHPAVPLPGFRWKLTLSWSNPGHSFKKTHQQMTQSANLGCQEHVFCTYTKQNPLETFLGSSSTWQAPAAQLSQGRYLSTALRHWSQHLVKFPWSCEGWRKVGGRSGEGSAPEACSEAAESLCGSCVTPGEWQMAFFSIKMTKPSSKLQNM